ADGSLGPLITQRLAVYLGKPVRCTSGDGPALSDDSPLYVAQGRDVRVWFRLDALLASAIADAMIGGEGNAPKVGYGSKVARVAAGAVTEMTRVVAAALQLPELSPAEHDQKAVTDLRAAAGGTLSVATHNYGWQAGISVAAPATSETISVVSASPSAAPVAAHPVTSPHSPAGIEVALERARERLEEMLGRPVAFESFQMETLVTPRVPQGWPRMSLTARGEGAVVLALSRQTEAALVRSALGADASVDAGGILMDTGAEVILRGALFAFAAEIFGTSEELHNIVRLSDSAMLAELPHRSVEHRIACGKESGVLRWLVPEQIFRQRVGTASGFAAEKL
ncbi:MAG TPA: hypothetical protein VGW96_03460, partial [Candidatus Eremiobacteraceae bacterium]|nr:hypothetical protein [Candidatus Eremiobacteraceae bacterium]